MIYIFYFSGTGNTQYIAERLAAGLNQAGLVCAPAISIEEIEADQASQLISSADKVFFGYPIYGSYTCQLMVDFLSRVRVPESTVSGFFCTQWGFSGDGARIGCSIANLQKKPRWGMHFNMPNNLNCGKYGWLPVTNNPLKIKKILLRNNRKILKLVRYIQMNKAHRTGFSTLSHLLGLIQRPAYLKVYQKTWRKSFSINQDRCTRCGKCFNICPVRNITRLDQQYWIQDRCVICMRCYNFCPVHAVEFQGRAHARGKETYLGPVLTDGQNDII